MLCVAQTVIHHESVNTERRPALPLRVRRGGGCVRGDLDEPEAPPLPFTFFFISIISYTVTIN